MYTYSQLFERLDYELKQRQEYGSKGDPDRFRYLRSVDGKRIVSEVMYQLYSLNAGLTLQEVSVVGRDFSVPEAFDESVVYLEQKNETLLIPEFVFNIQAYKVASTWYNVYDSSSSNSLWYSPNRKLLAYRGTTFDTDKLLTIEASIFPKYIKDNVSMTAVSGASVGSGYYRLVAVGHKFEIGDVVALTSASYPTLDDSYTIVAVDASHIWIEFTYSSGLADIVLEFDTDETEIDMPVEYMDLLTLEIKRKVYERKGELIPSVVYSRLMQLRGRWQKEQGRVRRNSHLSTHGFGYGKR